MSQVARKHARLMIGCGSAALALGLMLGPASASAQGIQANGNIVSGAAAIDQSVTGQTTVTVGTPTVVIDWTPLEDASGNALEFLPANRFAYFENDPNAQAPGQYAVLNRILPATNGNVAVINGSVISQVFDANGGSSIGGFIAFYSPTGLLIGSTAFFDVGQLMLTTLNTDNASFETFAQQGFGLALQGATGSTAGIRILPGAQILATPENAFFAVVAADIEMRGTARVNGSHAYVVGEQVNLSLSNGLFSINVPVGTAAAGEVLTLDGNIGGPSSTGVTGDNHLIYAVARASADPISMLFRGNLGFDPAQNAGVVNGEIILSANYNVFGRSVGGGSVDGGVTGEFRDTAPLTNVRADIDIADATVSSTLLALGSHRVTATATGANSSFAGNLLLVGRQNAQLIATGDRNLTIAGDVLVDARDYGVSGSFLQSLDLLNAQGGAALVEASASGTILVGGQARVLADALAGVETLQRIAGIARGGSAAISSNGGTIDITGATTISAKASGPTFSGIRTGAEARGGTAELRVSGGGDVTLRNALTVSAAAEGASGDTVNPSTVSNAFGGNARIALLTGGGTLNVTGRALLDASASSRSVNATGAGALADAGEATVNITASGTIAFADTLELLASASAGQNFGGTGGNALGGRASATTQDGGTITVAGDFLADAGAFAGSGRTGGDGLGGIAGANARLGRIEIAGLADVNTSGRGGSAAFGFGGNGGIGRGGNSFLQADGTLTQTATLTIGGAATVASLGFGGAGGQSDGSTIAAGRGGDGYGGQFTVPNQADPTRNSGAFVLAGGDNGTISVGGLTTVLANGEGGVGGNGNGAATGGNGGNGFGGLGQVGLALLGQNGSVGLGRATFGDIILSANGSGARAGIAGSDIAIGTGGSGTGGTGVLTVRAGDITAGNIFLEANGGGGAGGPAGTGTGGTSGVFGSLGGTLDANSLTIRAFGFGGLSDLGTAGLGLGGLAEMQISATTVTIAEDIELDAGGFGGAASDGAGGIGRGGEARIVTAAGGAAGQLTANGHVAVLAAGQGGTSLDGFAAGDGVGGRAAILSRGGSMNLGSLQMAAVGRGGISTFHEGGNGTGGVVELISGGTGNTITVLRNVPSSVVPESPGGFAMLNASGFGELTTGGDGIGGTGQGGTVRVEAATGGTINLPVDILSDPNRAADSLFMLARGIGGDSVRAGGAGGLGLGGSFTMLVDGGTLVSGPATPSVFGQGGNSGAPSLDITGGDAVGGTRTIRVINNGSLTLQTNGGGAGAQGGTGSGLRNGGNATAGAVVFEVINAVANLAGSFNLFNSAQGGAGHVGGDAGGGSITVNTQNAQINLVNGVGGPGVLAIGSEMTGGAGVTRGGTAQGTTISATFNATTLGGGTLDFTNRVTGGAASAADGAGGNATGTSIQLFATDSTLNVTGPLDLLASATGGAGGANGVGGDGTGGTATASLTNTVLQVSSGAQTTPARINLVADGIGGLAGTVGDGQGGSASFTATGGTVTAVDLTVAAQGVSVGTGSQIEGDARGGTASFTLLGDNATNLDSLTVNSSASTGPAGSASGGLSIVTLGAGSTATLAATDLAVLADATGANQSILNNTPGRFRIEAAGGNVNLVNLTASASGNRQIIDLTVPPSTLLADGGNINVAANLNVVTYGDLLTGTRQGGIIGAPAAAGVNTNIGMSSLGTIRVVGDATGRGLSGQSISLTAGRSIILEGNLTTFEFPITLTANTGGGQIFSQPPLSMISMAAGSRINAGTGTVTIHLLDGAGDPQRPNGAITLANVSGSAIDVRNFGSSTGSDITVPAGSVLTASGTGRAIDLASLNGEVINLAGDAGLVLTGGGHYGIFAATPTGSQIGSFANYARRYNVADAAAYDQLNPGGNFAAFRIAPVLTVTANNAVRFYGDANPVFTATYTGFLPGDGVTDLAGAPSLTTLATGTSNVGQFAIDAALGSLLSAQGYQFTFAPGVLDIVPRPITVAANSLTRFYGNANPALTFTVGGLGLVNGDQLTGALATTAGATTGVGNVAITQGTLAASSNYALTFVNGQLTITPRPITITADSFSRIYGNANPVLTFTVGGLGLVNGDQLSGALATGGVTTGVGSVPITLGSLSAGANYAITFNPGTLTITPRPLTVAANNLIKTLGLPDPVLTFLVTAGDLVNGDQFSGALTRDPGEAIGSFAIRQGTLTAGANYTITFRGATFTIDPPPTPPEINNPTVIQQPLVIEENPPPVEGEEEERFGMDFPEQPDAPLIAEDPLLDDPVASGGDPAIYGSGGGAANVPPAGDK